MPSIKIHGHVYDLDAPVFGSKAIARVRGQSERQVFHAAAEGRFTFRKDGRIIVTTPREALEPLIGQTGIQRLIVDSGQSASPTGGDMKSAFVAEVA